MSPEVFNDAELRCAEIHQRCGKKESKAADSWLGSSEGSPRSKDKVWCHCASYILPKSSSSLQTALWNMLSCVFPTFSRARRSSALFFKLFW